MKCANCQRDALYSYPVSGGYAINYCQSHLPGFLASRKKAGLLPLQTPKVVEEPAPAKASKKKEVEPVEEAPVEELPEED